ncbi:SRPBCC domain-containing protein [Demequina aurantiaca]|uniref:SRPBCC domain-containing protein n=1 Tax=Demequina aurantiaca TaxID=676200 RepID=UPI000780C8AA|nr:SRPBCC domain-containing protein [Demequina aurantiaca]
MIHLTIEVSEEPPQIVMTERMPYPRDKVWLVHTEALYLKEWWAPTGYENTWVDTNPEPGGTWRVVQRDPEGNEFSFYGHYTEVERHKRMVQSRTSEIFPDAGMQITLEFSEIPGGTQIVTTQDFLTERNLQGYLQLGGLERDREASARLDALLGQMMPRDDRR